MTGRGRSTQIFIVQNVLRVLLRQGTTTPQFSSAAEFIRLT